MSIKYKTISFKNIKLKATGPRMNSAHQFVSDLQYEGESVSAFEAMKFREGFPVEEDFYSYHIVLTIEDSLHNKLQIIKEIVSALYPKNAVRVVSVDNEHSIIKVDTKLMVLVNHYRELADLWEIQKSQINVKAYGNPNVIKNFSILLKERMNKCKSPQVTWHYMAGGHRDRAVIFLENGPTVRKEYYPWMDEEPNAYIDRFMQSDCSLLILRGEPGTGKTSFIRNILYHCDAKAMITYEEELFKSDDLFVEFLTEESNILIMEDADALLESRIQKGNTSMTKFLNVSDGIIKFPRKKLIISANTIDNSKIDEALLRPGRCFDAPIFRRMRYDETIVACNAAGIPVPPENRSYSLAEIFSYSKGESASAPKSGRDRVGFGFAA